jgi:hypothetical protein
MIIGEEIHVVDDKSSDSTLKQCLSEATYLQNTVCPERCLFRPRCGECSCVIVNYTYMYMGFIRKYVCNRLLP